MFLFDWVRSLENNHIGGVYSHCWCLFTLVVFIHIGGVYSLETWLKKVFNRIVWSLETWLKKMDQSHCWKKMDHVSRHNTPIVWCLWRWLCIMWMVHNVKCSHCDGDQMDPKKKWSNSQCELDHFFKKRWIMCHQFTLWIGSFFSKFTLWIASFYGSCVTNSCL